MQNARRRRGEIRDISSRARELVRRFSDVRVLATTHRRHYIYVHSYLVVRSIYERLIVKIIGAL